MSVIFTPVSEVTLVFLSFFSSMFLSNESAIRNVGLLVNDSHALRDIRVLSVAFSFASRWFSLVRSLHSSSFSLIWLRMVEFVAGIVSVSIDFISRTCAGIFDTMDKARCLLCRLFSQQHSRYGTISHMMYIVSYYVVCVLLDQ